MMQTMWISGNGAASKDARVFGQVFNQVAMFSVIGLGMWTAVVIVSGLQVMNFWF